MIRAVQWGGSGWGKSAYTWSWAERIEPTLNELGWVRAVAYLTQTETFSWGTGEG